MFAELSVTHTQRCSISMSAVGPLVSCEWLKENLDKVKVLDASWYLSFMERSPGVKFDGGCSWGLRMCACMQCMQVCTYVSMHLCIGIHTYMNACMGVPGFCVCAYACMLVCMNARMHVCMYVCTNVHMYMMHAVRNIPGCEM